MKVIELARDLGLTPARISQLRAQGLVAVHRDGSVNRAETLRRLHMYWMPAPEWWDKPVGPIGQELRRRWRAEEQRANTSWTLRV